MKKILLGFLFFIYGIYSYGQFDTTKTNVIGSYLTDDARIHISDSITSEGKKLYNSEIASWYGTDIFVQQFKDGVNNIGGYFSYPDYSSETCLFYSKGDSPLVLGTTTFDSSFNLKNVIFNGTKRNLTPHEAEIWQLRTAAQEEIKKDTSFFLSYRGTTFNLIPFIEDDSKILYILTGTTRTDVVYVGNDYLLKFDSRNNLISHKRLHANIIPLPVNKKVKKNDVGNVHIHLPETGDFITATDICTFMLNEKVAKWKQQMVVSEHFMSIWNCESNSLIILPTGR